MTTTIPIIETPAVAPKPELTARHLAAINALTEDERALVNEALTVNLDYVRNDTFKKASAEREGGWSRSNVGENFSGGGGSPESQETVTRRAQEEYQPRTTT